MIKTPIPSSPLILSSDVYSLRPDVRHIHQQHTCHGIMAAPRPLNGSLSNSNRANDGLRHHFRRRAPRQNTEEETWINVRSSGGGLEAPLTNKLRTVSVAGRSVNLMNSLWLMYLACHMSFVEFVFIPEGTVSNVSLAVNRMVDRFLYSSRY